jgi:hypothetical protein
MNCNHIATGFHFVNFADVLRRFVCPNASLIHRFISPFVAPTDLIIHIQLGLSIGISRELLLQIQSFDCLEDYDAVILGGHSLQSDHIPSSSIRAEMRSLIAMFQMKSSSELHVTTPPLPPSPLFSLTTKTL